MKNKMMVMVATVAVIIIVVLAVIFYLQQNEAVKEGLEPAPTMEPSLAAPTTAGPENAKKQFSFAIKVGYAQIHLGDDEVKVDLTGILGKPLSLKTMVSGPEAFPYAGIHYKTYEYDGLVVTSYRSKEGPVLICSMVVTTPKYATASGIKVGDSLERLKAVYPVAKTQAPDAPGEIYELYDASGANWMSFEVKEGKIATISIAENWD